MEIILALILIVAIILTIMLGTIGYIEWEKKKIILDELKQAQEHQEKLRKQMSEYERNMHNVNNYPYDQK